MKQRHVKSAALAGACALVAWGGSAAAATNLVANPGFETGDLSGWTSAGTLGSDIGVDGYALDAHSGSYGAYLGNADVSGLSQAIATTTGASYEISFSLDVYQSAAYFGFFDVTFGGAPVVDLVEPAETDSFAQYTATVSASGPLSALVFSASDPGGYFGLDDISVTQLTSPVPELSPGLASLAGLGLVAWIARRRRGAVRSA